MDGEEVMVNIAEMQDESKSTGNCGFVTGAVLDELEERGIEAYFGTTNAAKNTHSGIDIHYVAVAVIDGERYVFDYTFNQFGVGKKNPWPLVEREADYLKRIRPSRNGRLATIDTEG